ncbi:MAG: DUF1573 domain-containing protein [Candidatus Hydrogenedentes bacterium]|nr:DUF1573 domain-containing protein [Candidatus Hydrogenedentota bacterium]
MRVRGSHIVLAVCFAVAAFIVFAIVYESRPSEPVDADEDVLEAARALRQDGKGSVPMLALESDVLDFGTVPNDRPTTRNFIVRNEGQVPLQILNWASSCGACTLANITESAKNIPPGGEGIVEVTTMPKGIHGFVSRKTVTLQTSDPLRPTAMFEVVCSIDPEFSVEPEPLDFGEVEKGVGAEMTMRIRQLQDQPIEVTGVEPGGRGEHYTLSFQRVPESEWAQPGKMEHLVKVALLPSIPTGKFYDNFNVASTCERIPHYRCIIRAEVTSFYTVEPNMLSAMKRVQPGQQNVATAVVQSNEAIEVLDLAVSGTGLTVSSKPGADEHSVIIELGVAPDAEPGLIREEVSFTVKGGERAVPHTVRAYASVGDSEG